MNKFERIGIIGEGKMGTSIFLYLLGFDFPLAWLCSSEAARDEVRKLFMKKIGSKLHCGVITEQEYTALMDSTVITSDAEDLSRCHLIIEAIPEDQEMKRQLFLQLDNVINRDCIFTSNSSSIVPSRLAPSMARSGNFAGMHFFFPVQLKKYVEMVLSPATSPATTGKLEHFLRHIHKVPFIQDEENAFLLNRLFLDFQAGAYEISREGKLSFRQIDLLVKEHFFPSGVFEFFDHVGIDVMLASIRAYSEELPERADISALVETMEKMENEGRLGLKSRRGFFDYSIPGSQKDAVSGSQIDEGYRRDVISRLRKLFTISVENAIESGTASREFLREAVKDYTGTDESLF